MYTPNTIDLFNELRLITDPIPTDFGGGALLSKSLLMADLFLRNGLKNYVEIGVYRGRSFFPMAYAARHAGGMACGIDPYDCQAAKEYDLEESMSRQVNSFLESLDFDRLYDNVLDLRQKFGLTGYSEVIRAKSSEAIEHFRANSFSIDMLHIDGNHDTAHVMEDVELYSPMVRMGGFVVLDDINWDSVRPAYDKLAQNYEVIFNNGFFAIFLLSIPGNEFPPLEKIRLSNLFAMIENYELGDILRRSDAATGINIPKISVIITAYNHEEYIAECLESVLAQKGRFSLELILGDDGSTDSTNTIMQQYLQHLCSSLVEVKLLPHEGNLGITHNFKRCLEACTGQYIAVCEGDDFWLDCQKLQKQLDFLESHPECSFCFNDIKIYYQAKGELSLFELQQIYHDELLATEELIKDYFIGNISCCMYKAEYLRDIPADLFKLYIGDWMFNITYSQFGKIGHLREVLSVYRKHDRGSWSSQTSLENAKVLYACIDEYNKFLDFKYDQQFTARQKLLEAGFPHLFAAQPVDLAIIDDAFPHPLSAFRIQEFLSYYEEFDRLRIYCSGISVPFLGKRSLPELIADFKRSYPEYAKKIEPYQADSKIQAKLLYLDFLGNTNINMDKIDELQTPFVFTLYPGGMFGLNNKNSDQMLRRVTSSPCFRKVIVTQQVTYDYLVENKFCKPNQIEFIFGAVMPLSKLETEYNSKKRFGFGKDTLDICFVAFKYTETGIDKGYDVFIASARELSLRHDNIHFHVVGGFDEHILDVSDFAERITFYGPQTKDWFDAFYEDKDLILSPNTPSKIIEGCFDGFPTGTCVDAAFRKTAVFCTDELHLNRYFADGEEIVIIPHNSARIVEIIEKYYEQPEKLKVIGENGYHKFNQLYSYEAQILPRINLLKRELSRAEESKKQILARINRGIALGFRLFVINFVIVVLLRLKKSSPLWLRKLLLAALDRFRSYSRFHEFALRICPGLIKRIFMKVMTPT